MMKRLICALSLLCSLALAGHAQDAIEIGGLKVVTATRAAVSTTKPEFTSITVAPGRGMEVLQITANFPGKGNINMLATPDLATAKKILDEKDDDFGNMGYRLGAAFLAPYPNRVRGTLSADGKTLTTAWKGLPLTLPANNIGHLPGAERHAMHGLILKAKAEDVTVEKVDGGQEISGVIRAGDFGSHWPSKTQLVVIIRMPAHAVDVRFEASNIGKEAEPMALAWHPYFNLPSGNRAQARVVIPATTTAELDNYDNVFPTGKLLPIAGTKFDMNYVSGTELQKNYYDDNWSHLVWEKKAATVRVMDPAAHYGVLVEGLSPEIKTIQMFAPPQANFVVIEHQDNFADPFGKEWDGMDTGMITLKPGETTRWHVRLKLYVP